MSFELIMMRKKELAVFENRLISINLGEMYNHGVIVAADFIHLETFVGGGTCKCLAPIFQNIAFFSEQKNG